MDLYKCNTCGVKKELNADNYYRNKHTKTGYHYMCKECSKIKRKEFLKERQKKQNYVVTESAKCTSCKEEKELNLDNFQLNSSNPNGYDYYCKECRVEYNESYHEIRRETKGKITLDEYECRDCKETKPMNTKFFEKRSHSITGYDTLCNSCKDIQAEISKEKHRLRQRRKREFYKTGKNYVEKKEQFCNKCKTSKPLNADYFHRDRGRRTGFLTQCKSCINK